MHKNYEIKDIPLIRLNIPLALLKGRFWVKSGFRDGTFFTNNASENMGIPGVMRETGYHRYLSKKNPVRVT
jgi:hypothetical protein